MSSTASTNTTILTNCHPDCDIYSHSNLCSNSSQESKMSILSNDLKYEEVVVNEEELKFRRLTESQERHITRLERTIERLEEELLGFRNGNEPVRGRDEIHPVPTSSNTTLPQGIQLPSVFRSELEVKLREKWNQKKEAEKE